MVILRSSLKLLMKQGRVLASSPNQFHSPKSGVSVYRYIAAKGFEGDLFIGTSLVNMFCKMGRLDTARKVFDKMPNKDTASWNVMISGLLQSLHPSEAVEMFWKMNENVLDLRSNKVSALLVEEENRIRMLGLEYRSKRSYLGLEYYEGTISIKIMLVGIHMGQIESVMKMADEECINLKILVMEQMLKQHPKWQGRAVLVQIVNPTSGKGIHVEEVLAEIQESYTRINRVFSRPGYEPIVFIDRAVPITEKVAYHSLVKCVIVTALRDEMNLMPYEYTVSRQGSVELDKALGVENDEAKKSVIIVSEFIGCPPLLSCAIRVNLWNICL
ncbi:unnamed protein product [Vicia faba]|uniref:Uncharacterized protein n=1 Tax=Vicia faba TaxID=3906 RepID=A0AAV0YLU9_VICFA|nr:unnamed protein product [Vicia faba]